MTEHSGMLKAAKCNIIDSMTTAKEFGFRITGMTIKNPETGKEILNYGKTDSPNNIKQA